MAASSSTNGRLVPGPLCLAIIATGLALTTLPAHASKISGYFFFKIPNPETSSGLDGFNDLHLFLPDPAFNNMTHFGKQAVKSPKDAGVNDPPQKLGDPVDNDKGQDTQLNNKNGHLINYQFPDEHPEVGDTYAIYVSGMTSHFRGTKLSFTKDGTAIQGNSFDLAQFLVPGNNSHIVTPGNSFFFSLGLHNETFSPDAPNTVPIVFSNMRLFTDVDFGQTDLMSGLNAIDAYLDPNNPAFSGNVLDLDGNLIKSVPGTEIDLDTLLAPRSEWDPILRTFTLEEEDAFLPNIHLETTNGIVLFAATATLVDPDLGEVSVTFVTAHQVSQVVPAPLALPAGFLILSALALRRTRRVPVPKAKGRATAVAP